MWGMYDDRQGVPSEINDGAPSFSVWISKRIQIWDGSQKVAVEIYNSIYGGRKTEKLIESRCFI